LVTTKGRRNYYDDFGDPDAGPCETRVFRGCYYAIGIDRLLSKTSGAARRCAFSQQPIAGRSSDDGPRLHGIITQLVVGRPNEPPKSEHPW